MLAKSNNFMSTKTIQINGRSFWQHMEELNFEEAPDKFLDHIMSQLMNDPVI